MPNDHLQLLRDGRFSSIPPMVEEVTRVLVVCDDAALRTRLQQELAQDGYDVKLIGSDEKIMPGAPDVAPTLVVVSAELANESGYAVCDALRMADHLRGTPIVMLLPASPSEDMVVRALLAGADDTVSIERPVELRSRIAVRLRTTRYRRIVRTLRDERDLLRQEATTDPLTGVLNRKALEKALHERVLGNTRFGVLFLDLDHFKKVNDDFGHDLGDQVLCAVAHKLNQSIRNGDVFGRFGGEEFVMLLGNVDAVLAERVAERHRKSIESLRIAHATGHVRVTVSIGVAVWDPAEPDAETSMLLRRADEALYRAKHLGRNRVELATLASVGVIDEHAAHLIEVPTSERSSSSRPSIASLAPVTVPPLRQSNALETELVRKLEQGLSALPVLPTVAAEALRVATNPDADIAAFARLVGQNPHFAARFLSVANSAVYGRGVRTTTVRDSVVRLGLATSRDLVFQVVYGSMNQGMTRFQKAVQSSFRRSVLAGLAAREIGRAVSRRYPYDYLCGLLHDIGEARVYRILAGMPKPVDDTTATELVAHYHKKAGEDLARAWNLPDDIVDVCGHHHDPERQDFWPIRLVVAADAAVALAELAPEARDPVALAELAVNLALDADRLDGILATLRDAKIVV